MGLSLPSAADLDAIAEEMRIKAATLPNSNQNKPFLCNKSIQIPRAETLAGIRRFLMRFITNE